MVRIWRLKKAAYQVLYLIKYTLSVLESTCMYQMENEQGKRFSTDGELPQKRFRRRGLVSFPSLLCRAHECCEVSKRTGMPPDGNLLRYTKPLAHYEDVLASPELPNFLHGY